MPLWGLLGEAKASFVATNAFISRWPPNLRGQFLLVCSCFVIFYTSANILTAITTYCGSRVAVRARDISICMNRLGYVQCRVGNLRGWNVVPLSGNDIHNNHCLNAHRSRPDET